MSDLLTWTDPRTVAVSASTQAGLIAAIVAAFAVGEDEHWAVNASDTTWVELKPKAGPYVDDRLLINGTSTATNLATMLTGGAARATTKVLLMVARDDGGAGPDAANIDTATGPYAGLHTGYAEWCFPAVAGNNISHLTIVSSRDVVMLSAWADDDGSAWWAMGGRALQSIAGDDEPIVMGCGSGVSTTYTTPNITNWATQAATVNPQSNQPFTTDAVATATDTPRMGWASAAASMINLVRANGILTVGSWDDTSLTGAFVDMLICLRLGNSGSTIDSVRQLIGKLRQMKIGGPRRVGNGVWVDSTGATRRKVQMASSMTASSDTLWLTDHE
jgi:hypothetical protein